VTTAAGRCAVRVAAGIALAILCLAPRPAGADDTLSVVLGTGLPPLMDTLDLVAQGAGFYRDEHLTIAKIIVPGAAEALKRTGKAGKVALCGNTTPGPMKAYIKEGVLESFFLWDPRKLGDLTVRLAVALAEGQPLKPGASINGSPPLTFSQTEPTTVIMLTEPLKFTRQNIDQFDWGF